jgi:3-hydroxyacyl-CoA dehydrogenase / enoyl-CoA hydratase / 3-hydroxybutyryl-CoA epimerase
MSNAFRLSIQDSLATVTFDLPGEKVNKFSTPVMEELSTLTDKLAAAPGIAALILRSGKENIFIAGADVREIENITSPEDGRVKSAVGQQIFDRWAKLPFPTVAAIGGACLGGGTEIALACDYRVASDSPKVQIGLPEVKLGILPGWGGTQRLPRLVGLAPALDLILTGRSLDGRRARRIGLVDEVVPEPLFERWTEAFARKQFGKPKRRRRPKRGLRGWLLEGNPLGRRLVFSRARTDVLRKTHGHYPAPLEALAAVEEGYGRKLADGLQAENRHLGNLIGTPVQKNLMRIFFWTEEVKKETGAINPTVQPRPVARVGVLGAGIMGGGIAQLAADRGLPVRMKDIAAEPLAHGFQAAAQVWQKKLSRGRLSPREFRAKMALLSGGYDYAGFPTTEVTIEAVVEKLAVKQAVLREWEAAVPDDRIFASNTSTIPISQIAAQARVPKRVVGMHFFNPVDRMPLVEVIRGERSSDETVATVFELAKRLGKTPVVVRDAPGFLVNRILAPYLAEAVRLLQDGCRIEDIDRAMTDFGMPVGPLALLDDVGIDVAAKAGETLAAAFPARMAKPDEFGKLAAEGRAGRKSGAGFYRYAGSSRGEPNTDAYGTLRLKAPRHSALPSEVIEGRLLMPMVNEAAFCLEDRIVDSPARLDLAMIFGTGFPPFRGGLLRYADDLGIARIVSRLEDMTERLGERFSPAPRLRTMASAGQSFYGGAP